MFYAYTPFHLFSAAYYAMRVQWSANTKKCLIWYKYNIYKFDIDFLKPYFDDIIVIDDSVFDILPIRALKRCINGGYLFRWSKVGQYILEQKHNNVFVCFSDQEAYVNIAIALLKKFKNNIICMMEEGDATYAFQNEMKWSLHRRIAYLICGCKKGNYIGHTDNIDFWVVRHPELLPGAKRRISDVIKQNNIFLDEGWSNQFQFLWAGKISSADYIKSRNKRRILWIGGPIDAHGVTNDEEISWLMEIADIVKDDYVILIKVHAREKEEKFLRLSDHPAIRIASKDLQGVPVEFFAQAYHPDIILTVSSSAAFHIYEMGFYGKVIYSDRRFEKIRIDRDVIKKYVNYENIYDVQDLTELKHVIYDVPLQPREQMLEHNTDEDLRYFETLEGRFEKNDK